MLFSRFWHPKQHLRYFFWLIYSWKRPHQEILYQDIKHLGSNLEAGIIIGKDSYKVILTAITIVKRSVEKEYD